MGNKVKNIVNDNRFSTLMLICIAAYACLKFPFRSVADIFQTIFLIGFIAYLTTNHAILTRNKIYKLFILTISAPILSWISSNVYLPEFAEAKPSLGNFINLFYFIPIALLLKQNRTSIWCIWGAFSLGLILSSLYYSPDIFQMIKSAFNGVRVTYGFYNLQHASAWSGACIIIALAVLIKGITTNNKLVSLVAILLMTPFLFIFLTTQTRQTFLGLFAAIILASPFYIAKAKVRLSKVFLSVVIFIGISTLAFNQTGIRDRTVKETKTLISIVSGDYSDFSAADDSTSVRYALWYAGFQWVKDYPMLGGGKDISEHIINVSPYTPEVSKELNHRHLHSYYMEMLVSYGIVGLSIIIFIFAYIYWNLWNRKSEEGFDEVQFVGLVFIPYWLIVNFFEPHLLTSPGQLIHNVMIGSFFFFDQSKTDRLTS
ncbi:O-antigen ligase family protein [Vibrio sinaloensis]|uniref:O-antigen ligase-related domain-containing protein n=1 Tax=Photobacterium sp. (strain ATCC 43367) TaxID=379097 RepID=A0A0A5HVC2_PHOS4|nr:O-antigen ligase family protein [Vibrio sinaloensis]KGY07461.1 hypothetical protein NM06_16765 [Vibrio sinaloensis]